MADLIDRISGESLPSRPKIPTHQFIAGIRLYADGLATRGEISTNWGLVGDEVTQAGNLADNIDAEVGLTDKLNYVLRIEAIAMLVEDQGDQIYHTAGVVDKVAVKTDLGIP